MTNRHIASVRNISLMNDIFQFSYLRICQICIYGTIKPSSIVIMVANEA